MVEQLPQDVIARLRALDSAVTPELSQASWALLTPFHEKLGYTAPWIVRDLQYGEHPRRRLDVHAPVIGGTADRGAGERGAPVFLFVHGGGFVAGDKHRPGTPVYDMVGAWAVRHGWVGVNMTYRYAPEVKWPAGAEDVAAAVAWLRGNIAAYGGDPDRIVVAGNSAGAVHVADFAAGHGGDLAGVRGAALISGIYHARPAAPAATPHPYYGVPDPVHASLPCLVESHVPLLFAVAERDPERFQVAAAEVVAAWLARHGTVPNLVWMDGHNHMSAVGSLGVDEAALGVPLARFIERYTGLSD
ncbi:MAG TPA: alpha/beta hydrolase [Trebonia sp.]|nr:alpha/beta hydrolase [Trebonia sp.]